jgi:hypothetical protein
MNKIYLLILISASFMILFYGRINIENAPFDSIPDIKNYRLMAEAAPGLDETVSRNFGYRILLPYIAGLMPFSIDANFYIITIILSLLLPLIFFRFLKDYGLKEDTSLYLTLLFLAGRYTYGFAVWDFYDVHDLLTYNLILLFLMGLKKDRFLILSIILSIGVLNRETVLFLVPSAFFYYSVTKKDKKRTGLFLLSVLPAIIILTLLRSLVTTESAAGKGVIYSLGKLRFDESQKLLDPVTYYRIINTFIPLTFIPLVFFETSGKFFKEYFHLFILAATYIASCFLAGDTERLIVPAFPVFFVLLGIIFEKYGFKSLKDKMFLLMLCVVSIPHHIFFRYRLPHRNWKVAVSLLTLAAVTFYFYRLKRKDRVLNNNSDI